MWAPPGLVVLDLHERPRARPERAADATRASPASDRSAPAVEQDATHRDRRPRLADHRMGRVRTRTHVWRIDERGREGSFADQAALDGLGRLYWRSICRVGNTNGTRRAIPGVPPPAYAEPCVRAIGSPAHARITARTASRSPSECNTRGVAPWSAVTPVAHSASAPTIRRTTSSSIAVVGSGPRPAMTARATRPVKVTRTPVDGRARSRRRGGCLGGR